MGICEYGIGVQYMLLLGTYGTIRADGGLRFVRTCAGGSTMRHLRNADVEAVHADASRSLYAHRHQTRQAVRALVLTISVDRRTHFRMVLGSLLLTRDDWKDITIIAIRRLEAGVRLRGFAW